MKKHLFLTSLALATIITTGVTSFNDPVYAETSIEQKDNTLNNCKQKALDMNQNWASEGNITLEEFNTNVQTIINLTTVEDVTQFISTIELKNLQKEALNLNSLWMEEEKITWEEFNINIETIINCQTIEKLNKFLDDVSYNLELNKVKQLELVCNSSWANEGRITLEEFNKNIQLITECTTIDEVNNFDKKMNNYFELKKTKEYALSLNNLNKSEGKFSWSEFNNNIQLIIEFNDIDELNDFINNNLK